MQGCWHAIYWSYKKLYNTFNFCVQKRWRNMNSHYLVVKTNSSEFLPWQSGRLIINHKSLLHFIQNIWPRMRRNNITDYDLLSAFTTNKILNNLKTFVLMPRDCLLILNSGRLWREKGKEKMLKNTDVTSEPVEVNIFWRS